MSVLLTRPLKDSLTLAALIDAAGGHSFVEPMFRVEYLPHSEFDKALAEYSKNCSVIFTSKHAVESINQPPSVRPNAADILFAFQDPALSNFGNLRSSCMIGYTPVLDPRSPSRILKSFEYSHSVHQCFAIKGETASSAQTSGFLAPLSANNAHSLAECIKNEGARDKLLLYPRGRKISLDLKQILEADGFSVKEFIVYETVERTELSDEIVAKLRSNQIKTIPFYSRNTVDIFARLIEKAGLSLKNIMFLSISKELQTYIMQRLNAAEVQVFNNEAELLATIKNIPLIYSSLYNDCTR